MEVPKTDREKGKKKFSGRVATVVFIYQASIGKGAKITLKKLHKSLFVHSDVKLACTRSHLM